MIDITSDLLFRDVLDEVELLDDVETVLISFDLDSDLWSKLEVFCKEQGHSPVTVLNVALHYFFKLNEN